MSYDGSSYHGLTAFPTELSNGMSLRDWFAGQALCGLMARNDNLSCPVNIAEKGANAVMLWRQEQHLVDAAHCYEMADAMLSRR